MSNAMHKSDIRPNDHTGTSGQRPVPHDLPMGTFGITCPTCGSDW